MNTGYVIFIHALAEGDVPLVRSDGNKPFVFQTVVDAQREIADDVITRLHEFINGERDFEDAMTVEEFIVKVRVLPDGSVEDERGNHFD
ncbi:MAG: hypothetical protein K8R87_13305 [Verrucomicrobia bacterium]|nr:hypothetical protein [Verrucomicrobiota bacterium]